MSSKHCRRFASDKVHWYFNEVTSKVVAKSGTPSDRHHLGKILLQSFKESPDFVMQIDGAKDESITHRSILQKSVKCATCFKKLGLKKGDVITIMAPNYVDISVPFYACLYLGMIVSPMDMSFNVNELSATFQVNMPKLVFCESEKAPDVQLALNNLELNCQIVTLDKGDYLCSLTEFLEAYGDDINVDDFEPEDFDPEETIAFLIPTSGTTGLPKSAAATHKNFATSGSYMWLMYSQFPTPVKMAFVPSPMQWLTAIMSFIVSPIFRYTRLMSSENVTPELTYQMLSKYKPNYTIMSPTMLTALLKNKEKCDLTCFSTILLGGSAVGEDLLQEIKAMTPSTEVFGAYGMTEVTGFALCTDYPPPGSCGRSMNYLEYRLIDVETQNDIYDAHTPGELWIRGPSLIKEYYNNPVATAEAFAEGRWFKTGDIFYRDENWYFYFVERLKLMLKYKGFQISPVEVENIIRQHPSVLDAAVVGIPDPECGDLVVACVVKKEGGVVSAQEIKDFVKNNLSDPKQLRGGVIFMENIPMTASTKVHRRKLKEMVLTMEKE